jgi:hypothetical protein
VWEGVCGRACVRLCARSATRFLGVRDWIKGGDRVVGVLILHGIRGGFQVPTPLSILSPHLPILFAGPRFFHNFHLDTIWKETRCRSCPMSKIWKFNHFMISS